MSKRLIKIAAFACLAGQLWPLFAQTKWASDSRVAQPAATNYCLHGVCLGMPLNQLPTILDAFSPEQGYWAYLGDPTQTKNEVARMVAMKNPCGTGDLHSASLSPEASLIFWTGEAKGHAPFFKSLLNDFSGARETLQRHAMEVTVSVTPKTAATDDSAYVVTGIRTRLVFAPEHARNILKILSTSWQYIKPVPPLATDSEAITHFTDNPTGSNGRSVLMIKPSVLYGEAENAKRFSSGIADAEFTWFLPKPNREKRLIDLLGEQPFCARSDRTATPIGFILK